MADSNAKRHHLVPRWYLKGFATGKERISVYQKERALVLRNQNIHNVTVESHLNTLSDLPIWEPKDFENWLAKNDDSIARQYNQNPGAMPRDEICHAAALQHLRGREVRSRMPHIMAAIASVKRPGFKASDIKGTGADIHYFGTAESLWEHTQVLLQRRICFVRAENGSFLTSDRPVLLRPDPEWEIFPSESIYYPWSRYYGIVFSSHCGHGYPPLYVCSCPEANARRSGDEDRTVTVPGKTVESLNRQLYSVSNEVLFHPSDETLLESLTPVQVPRLP